MPGVMPLSQSLQASRVGLAREHGGSWRATKVWGRHRARPLRAVPTTANAEQKQAGRSGAIPKYSPAREADASLRAEAEAPFRALRFFIFGSTAISAGLATLFWLPQLAATIGHAAGAKGWPEIGQDLAIDLGALAASGYFLRSDLKARDKQMARLQREERLGALQLELATGKVVRMSQLRSFARVVMVAGSRQQVEAALAAAEPVKEKLQERGVLVVPLPIFGSADDSSQAGAQLRPAAEDLRWRATPLRLDDWTAWFREQASLASAPLDRGLYVGLRLDGRVRASGTGCPPWQAFATQLPPVEGFFGGMLDGMDGRV